MHSSQHIRQNGGLRAVIKAPSRRWCPIPMNLVSSQRADL
jgi:hypothetical protein